MDFIKFLGTAGARFAVTRQIRKSGGIWISLENKQILIDPGPGSLIRCLSSKPPLNPQDLDTIFLSHRHIDHSNDINIMIEAMTNGGHNKKGVVFAPSDALDNDPVVLHHFRNHVHQIIPLTEKGSYQIANLSLETPIRHIHDVETYGLRIKSPSCIISYISDTKYFKNLETYYPSDILIVNVVLLKSIDNIKHLSIDDVEKIVTEIKPTTTILTHFGLTIIREKPWELAEKLSEKIGCNVIAASDGLLFPLN